MSGFWRNSLIGNQTKVDYSFLLIVFVMFAGIAWLKLSSLFAWLYTSDLFTYDQILQETLTGNFGLEFTYGNHFGERAYLYLLLLLPVKLIMGQQMVIFFVLLGPIMYFIAVLTIYIFFKQAVGSKWAFVYGVIFLLSFGFILPGLYEETYGFHPDNLSGFLGVTFTCFLIFYEQQRSQKRKALIPLLGLVMFFAFFILLKEEMALLGAVFFLVLFLWKRERIYLLFLGCALGVFILGVISISLLRTPFNIRNTGFISQLRERLNHEGLWMFFSHQDELIASQIPSYYGMLIIFLLVMLVSIFLVKRANIYAVALFLMGIVKMSSSFLIPDYSLITWHNFPGIILMTGAILIQLTEKDWKINNLVNLFTSLVLAGSIILFVVVSLPYYVLVDQVNNYNANLILEAKQDLQEIKTYVNPKQVVGIPAYTAIEWVDGFRYSFFPRGITMSPAGIAEYVVIPNGDSDISYHASTRRWNQQKIDMALQEEFSVVMQNDHFTLLKRHEIGKENEKDRKLFIDIFGKEVLGLGTQ